MARRSIDDLLGPEPEREEEFEAKEKAEATVETNWAILRKGVSLGWLAGIMGMDRKTVKKRLADCPYNGRQKHGSELYDPAIAFSYLVKPRFDIKDYMSKMNPTELPPMLRKEFWDAENKRLNYMERSGELWPTEDVLAVFAEAFKIIKTTTQVWADDIERDAGLKPEQYKVVTGLVDALREEIYKQLCEMPKERQTGSALASGPLAGQTDEEG